MSGVTQEQVQGRWQREGPKSAEEASQRVAAIEAAIPSLEQRRTEKEARAAARASR